ncbi:TadE/TadG family type IV pilus assembly protein [Streptomyces longisporoflavus]|uniref:TadE/TadG family type IV pilus assembly protein n=1 Tax=Streptomyces longisporoflavus TaxID=28044 RepID=A0ABW7R3Y2_9ACTN
MRHRLRWWWQRRLAAGRGPRGDSGIATLEFLIIAPVLLFISCLVLQLGVFFLASTAAHTAARKGAQTGAEFRSSPGQGAQRAQSWLNRVGVVQQAGVSTAGSTGERVRVTVTGHVMNFLPWDLRIERSAEDTVEKNG